MLLIFDPASWTIDKQRAFVLTLPFDNDLPINSFKYYYKVIFDPVILKNGTTFETTMVNGKTITSTMIDGVEFNQL